MMLQCVDSLSAYSHLPAADLRFGFVQMPATSRKDRAKDVGVFINAVNAVASFVRSPLR